MEKEMATHSSILAWRIQGTEEPGGLRSMGSHRVGHDWSDLATAAVPTEHLKNQLKGVKILLTLPGNKPQAIYWAHPFCQVLVVYHYFWLILHESLALMIGPDRWVVWELCRTTQCNICVRASFHEFPLCLVSCTFAFTKICETPSHPHPWPPPTCLEFLRAYKLRVRSACPAFWFVTRLLEQHWDKI